MLSSTAVQRSMRAIPPAARTVKERYLLRTSVGLPATSTVTTMAQPDVT
jgi:hypothetical protein